MQILWRLAIVGIFLCGVLIAADDHAVPHEAPKSDARPEAEAKQEPELSEESAAIQEALGKFYEATDTVKQVNSGRPPNSPFNP